MVLDPLWSGQKASVPIGCNSALMQRDAAKFKGLPAIGFQLRKKIR
jgi:hypothetical protein